jgi:hypothetical protein
MEVYYQGSKLAIYYQLLEAPFGRTFLNSLSLQGSASTEWYYNFSKCFPILDDHI